MKYIFLIIIFYIRFSVITLVNYKCFCLYKLLYRVELVDWFCETNEMTCGANINVLKIQLID